MIYIIKNLQYVIQLVQIPILLDNDELYEDDFETKKEKEEQALQVENAIYEAIDKLDPLYSSIVKDRLVNNMKYNDISTKHNLPLHTIKNRIARGKRILQTGLKEYRNI